MAPRRGPLLTQGMVSHPYPMAKDIQPLRTTCELCDRTFPSKDWVGHKNGKAHQEREKAGRAEETRNLAAANGDGFAGEGFTPDAGFGGGDAGSWGASGNDTTNFASTNFGASNDFSSSGGMRGGGGPGACYGCGEVGHNKRDCPSTGASRGCFNCGEQGHNKADCPNPSQGGGRNDRACYNCGIPGHNKADCTEPRKQGGGGGGGGGDRPCYNCGETGHIKSDCPNARAGGGGGAGGDRECFNCYQTGHGKNDCPNEKVLKCRNCDELGHHSKECPLPRDWSRVQCNNCKKFGHTVVRCKEPPAEEESGGWDTGAGADITSSAVDGSWGGDNTAASSGDWANIAEPAADQWGSGGDGGGW